MSVNEPGIDAQRQGGGRGREQHVMLEWKGAISRRSWRTQFGSEAGGPVPAGSTNTRGRKRIQMAETAETGVGEHTNSRARRCAESGRWPASRVSAPANSCYRCLRHTTMRGTRRCCCGGCASGLGACDTDVMGPPAPCTTSGTIACAGACPASRACSACLREWGCNHAHVRD